MRKERKPFGLWILGFASLGFWVLGFGFWIFGFGFWEAFLMRKENLLGFGFWVPPGLPTTAWSPHHSGVSPPQRGHSGVSPPQQGLPTTHSGGAGLLPVRSLPVTAPVRGKGPLKGRRSRNGPTLRKNGLFWSTAHKRKFPPNSGKVPPIASRKLSCNS